MLLSGFVLKAKHLAFTKEWVSFAMKEVECKRVCEGEWHWWQFRAVQVKRPPLNAFPMVYDPAFARCTLRFPVLAVLLW